MKTITLDPGVIEAIAGHYDEALRMIEECKATQSAPPAFTPLADENSNGTHP